MMNFGYFRKMKKLPYKKIYCEVSPIFGDGFMHVDGFCLLTSIQNLNEIIQIGGTTKQALRILFYSKNKLK